MKQEGRMYLRVGVELKDKFYSICEDEALKPSEILRRLIEDWVETKEHSKKFSAKWPLLKKIREKYLGQELVIGSDAYEHTIQNDSDVLELFNNKFPTWDEGCGDYQANLCATDDDFSLVFELDYDYRVIDMQIEEH